MIKRAFTFIAHVFQMRPDRSHRAKLNLKPRRDSFSIAMEDEAFAKFFSHTQLTANYFVATHLVNDEQMEAFRFLLAQAYQVGKRNGDS